MGVFNILGGCCNSSSVGSIAKKWECGQSDWTICLLSWGISQFIHLELDLPLFHRATFQSMDSCHLWSCPNSTLCRFLLLLLYQLEKQCQAQVASINSSMFIVDTSSAIITKSLMLTELAYKINLVLRLNHLVCKVKLI